MERKKRDLVHLIIHGCRDLSDESFADDFFKILHEVNPIFLPNRISTCEPIRTPFSFEEAKKMWVESKKVFGFFGGVEFKGQKFNGSISWKNDNSNQISLWFSTDLIMKNNGTIRFIDLAKKLFCWANGIYGYAGHISNLPYTPGLSYRTCLGRITWINIFGPPYIDMFGEEVLRTAPCNVEEFSENCFVLLTSTEPNRVNPEILEAQARVQKHLGEDAFFREETRPSQITLEDIKAGRDRPKTEGYRSPDFSPYFKDLENEHQKEGLMVIINDDGKMEIHKIEPE